MHFKAGSIAISLALLAASPSFAATETVRVEDFKKDLPKVAQKLLDIVAGEKQMSLAMGHFSGPAQHDANFGPGIEDLLTQALEDLNKGIVQKKAELSVQGSFAFVDDPADTNRVLVKLTLEVRNRAAERVKEFVAELKNNADIARILGLTVSLDPEGTKEQRNKEIKLRLGDPKVVIEGSRIRATTESKLAVEVFVKDQNAAGKSAPRAAKAEEGLAFIEIKRGEIYEVVIHNGGDREVAANLLIDGLDAFTFSEVLDPKTKKHKYSHYIIGAGKSATVVGWHLRDAPPDNYSSFLVTEYGKGASTRTNNAQGKTGVLTVAFSFTSPAGKGRGGSETGFGPPRTVKVQPQQRDFDPPHEFVTVRYAR